MTLTKQQWLGLGVLGGGLVTAVGLVFWAKGRIQETMALSIASTLVVSTIAAAKVASEPPTLI